MTKRANYEGSVYRRQDGRWCASISIPDGRDGRLRKSFYGRTRAEVSERMTAALRELHRGVSPKNERITVAQFLAQWVKDSESRVRPKTARRYRDMMHMHVIPELGGVALVKLTPQHVHSLMSAKLREGLSPRTVNHIRVALGVALGEALRGELVSRNVAALARPVKVERVELEALTEDDARAVLDAVRGTRLEAVVSVGLALGLRSGEILGLRWSDVDLDRGRLQVGVQLQRLPALGDRPACYMLVPPKTDKSRRTRPLPSAVGEVLRAHRARQAKDRLRAGALWSEPIPGLVFTTDTGKPLHGSTVLHEFQRTLAAAGLPRMTVHGLRHGAATLLLAQGVDLKTVSAILGHSQISLTADLYSHVGQGLMRSALDGMDAIFGGR